MAGPNAILSRAARAADNSNLAETAVRGATPEGVVRGVVEPSTSATETVVKFGAPAGAAGLVGTKFFESRAERARADQAAAISDDESLSSEQKERLLGNVTGDGDDDGGGGGGGGILASLLGGSGGGGVLPDFDVSRGIAILVVLLIVYRLAGNTNLNLGSGSSTGTGGGS